MVEQICQFDVWEPKREIPVGHGQTRRGWVVVACLGYSRAGGSSNGRSSTASACTRRTRKALLRAYPNIQPLDPDEEDGSEGFALSGKGLSETVFGLSRKRTVNLILMR